jgi:hypothetical protein
LTWQEAEITYEEKKQEGMKYFGWTLWKYELSHQFI